MPTMRDPEWEFDLRLRFQIRGRGIIRKAA